MLYTDDYVLFEDFYGVNHERTDYYGMDQTVSAAYKKMSSNRVHPFQHGIGNARTRENREDRNDREDSDDMVIVPHMEQCLTPSVERRNKNQYMPRDEESDSDEVDQDDGNDEDAISEESDPDNSNWYDPDTPMSQDSQYVLDYTQDEASSSLNHQEDDMSQNGEEDQHQINFSRLKVKDMTTKADRYDKAMNVFLNGYNPGFRMNDILEPILLYNIQSRIVNKEVFHLPQNL